VVPGTPTRPFTRRDDMATFALRDPMKLAHIGQPNGERACRLRARVLPIDGTWKKASGFKREYGDGYIGRGASSSFMAPQVSRLMRCSTTTTP
jgi:hypothetical protein